MGKRRKITRRGFLSISALATVGAMAAARGIGWSALSKEHQEAKSLPLNAVDFGRLKDGVYHGAYEGGMYGWRANECDVTVANGQVTDVQLVGSTDPGGENTDYEMLYDRVVQAQHEQKIKEEHQHERLGHRAHRCGSTGYSRRDWLVAFDARAP